MPRKIPIAVPIDQLPHTNGKPMASAKEAAATQRNSCTISLMWASRQRAMVPGTKMNNKGTMSGANTRLKYGGPTESLPKFKASMMSG